MKKDLLSILDARDVIYELIDDALHMKKNGFDEVLKKKTLAMIFEKSSTRTRVSFELAMQKLGGHAIFLGKNDIQLGRGETIEDTALVLSRYVDCIMYRAYLHENVVELAKHATVPVINGLDDQEHPCQVIADLMTIKEFKGKLDGLHAVYFGDGDNNMAHSLLLGCPMVGMSIKIVSPKKYWPSSVYIQKAQEMGNVEITEMEKNAAKDADVVITDTWVSMGDEAEKEARLKEFQDYTVNDVIMEQAKPDAIFLHCLPAYYGKEVTKEVAHGKQSVIFDEAENRMWAQMAILKWLLKP
ncbi:MAG: ornithine carbamoyltransferase [Thermoplasmata archaeon]|nr:MAG: ornithine carbamoyltransferase [Thermoplasmata archaeon]